MKQHEQHVAAILASLGEDPRREGLVDTPARWLRAMGEMTEGIGKDAAAQLGTTFDAEGFEEIVVVRFEYVSLCEHHLLPFTGTVRFAYMPLKRIVGLSKIPRMVQVLARRPQVQERLTRQIVDTFTNVNRVMKLPGHSHYAEVTMVWRTVGDVGFPAFETTYAAIYRVLRGFVAAPIRDATNEEVTRRLFKLFDVWGHEEPALKAWGGSRLDYVLHELRLGVRGTLDGIGHADGLTTYAVTRGPLAGALDGLRALPPPFMG